MGFLKQKNKRTSRNFSGILSCLYLITLSTAACAVEGINSSNGTPLPLGAGGQTAIWILPQTATNQTGNVGIGVPSPTANLEVKRGLKIGTDESFTGEGTECNKPGTLSLAKPPNGNLYLCDGAAWRNIRGQQKIMIYQCDYGTDALGSACKKVECEYRTSCWSEGTVKFNFYWDTAGGWVVNANRAVWATVDGQFGCGARNDQYGWFPNGCLLYVK